MTVVNFIAVSVSMAVPLAVAPKGMKGEYGTHLVMAADFSYFYAGVGKADHNSGYHQTGSVLYQDQQRLSVHPD